MKFCILPSQGPPNLKLALFSTSSQRFVAACSCPVKFQSICRPCNAIFRWAGRRSASSAALKRLHARPASRVRAPDSLLAAPFWWLPVAMSQVSFPVSAKLPCSALPEATRYLRLQLRIAEAVLRGGESCSGCKAAQPGSPERDRRRAVPEYDSCRSSFLRAGPGSVKFEKLNRAGLRQPRIRLDQRAHP